MEEEDKENKEGNESVKKNPADDSKKTGADAKKDTEEAKSEEEGEKKAEEGIPRGLQSWREAVRNCTNAAQLTMAYQILETSIAWDKSIMKVKELILNLNLTENWNFICKFKNVSSVPNYEI